jgi:hypothetical protein
MSLKSGGLHAVATWNLGTISAFAWRQRKTKKTCVEMAGRRTFTLFIFFPLLLWRFPSSQLFCVHDTYSSAQICIGCRWCTQPSWMYGKWRQFMALLRCWRLQLADTALNNALTSIAQRSTWEMSNSTGDGSYLTWYQWIIHYAVNLPALLLLGLSLGAAIIAVVTEYLSSDYVVMCI